MRRSLAPLVAIALLGAAGCSDSPPPTVVADDGTSERVQQLSRRVQELEAELRASIVGTREADELRDRFLEMEREVRALKEALGEGSVAGAPSAPAAPATAGEGSGAASGEGTPGYVPPTPAGPDGTFDEGQIASFRRIQEEVDRRKDAEQRSERVKRQLQRAGVTLEEGQEKAVIDRTIAHENEVRTLMRGGFGRTDEERAEVQKKIEDLRGLYERDIRAVLPADAADKVVETLGRANPGIMRRPIDRTTRQR